MNRIKIEQLMDEMDAKATGDTQTTLILVREITGLMKGEQIHDFRFARVLTGAFLFMEGKHDKERASIFLGMAIKAVSIELSSTDISPGLSTTYVSLGDSQVADLIILEFLLDFSC